MIFLKRRRLFIWLIKAYIRKWKRTIFVFFLLGLVFFFLLHFILTRFPFFSIGQNKTIGVLGTYTVNDLPDNILYKISYGLTTVSADAKPQPMAASSWKIQDGGKTYIFTLKKGLRFTDGTKFTSKEVNYNFENVKVTRPNSNTIIFKLRENYSPFLITVSRPIFRSNFVGLGNYKLNSIKFNGDFVNSVVIQNIKNLAQQKFLFYPTQDSLKTALILGEISETDDISDVSFKNTFLSRFPNYSINKIVNYSKIVTLFYNTQDKDLSDRRLRLALNYAIPNRFDEGLRNRTPYPPFFWVSKENSLSYNQDFNHVKLLLSSTSATSDAKLKLSIKTLPQYKPVAEKIVDSWKKIGIKSNIEVVDSLPSSFQIFLGDFNISKDPDQYTLWHSDQENNITGYKNLRIDKLLEDGRQTVDINQREKIYSDFQKYLLDDPPAAFLFFPYNYVISKK